MYGTSKLRDICLKCREVIDKMNRKISKICVIMFAMLFVVNILGAIEDKNVRADDPGLVAYWSFDEGSGSTVYDSSGYSNDGTIYGANWVDGLSGKALSFDGTNDYVLIPDNDILDLSDDFTLEFWLKTYDNVGRLPVVSKHTTLVDNDYSWTTFIEGDSTFNFENTPGWRHLISDSIIETDKWTHVVVTFVESSNDIRIYFNGILDKQGSVDIDIRNNDKDFIIGTQPHPYTPEDQGFYEGLLDEIMLYSKALSSSEVLNNYNAFAVVNQKPTITITSPSDGDTVSDSVTVTGTASDSDGSVQRVEFRVNTASWITISGTSSWSYVLNTASLTDGVHTLSVRSYDGETYSDISSIDVNINNQGSAGSHSPDNLVAHWSFDEGSGSKVYDSSGYGNDGTIYGANWVDGTSGKALSFDGTNDFIEIPVSGDSLNFADESFSWEIWIMRDEHNGDMQQIIGQGVESTNYGLNIGFFSDNRYFFVFWANDLNTLSLYPETGEWCHWAGTYNVSTNERKLFRNGVLVAENIATADYQGSGNLYIGGGGSVWPNKYFDGIIDEVRFYECDLFASEIQQHYLGNFEEEIQNVKPTVSITSPSNGAIVSGTVTIAGTADDSDGTIQMVQLKLNSGTWTAVSGTTSWSYSWDTTTSSDGSHTAYARSYDGEDYSDLSSIEITVNNPTLDQPTDPAAYWSFDEGSGSIANDESVNNNDGVINGATWVNGKRDYALDFDGTDDYVLVSDSDFLDLTGDFTIEMWIYPHDVGRGEADIWEYNQQWLLCKHKAFTNGDGSWGIFNALERDDFHWDYQGEDATDGVTDIQNNEWTHLAYTYDDTQNIFTIYVNGNIDTQATKDYDIQNTNLDLFFGCESKGSTIWHTYDGHLDEIVIYDRVLEPSEFWGLTFEQTDPVEKSTPGFTSTIAVATIVMTVALVAFFRRRN